MNSIMILVLDSILAVFLLGVLILCTIVYRRLSIIKDGQKELGELVNSLNEAVDKAQHSVSGIKEAATASEADLQATIKKARSMVDELSLMTEVGNNLANRLEAGSTPKRNKIAKTPIEKQSKEQQDILAALKEAR